MVEVNHRKNDLVSVAICSSNKLLFISPFKFSKTDNPFFNNFHMSQTARRPEASFEGGRGAVAPPLKEKEKSKKKRKKRKKRKKEENRNRELEITSNYYI